jgi:sugar lactone lactonase YvrE
LVVSHYRVRKIDNAGIITTIAGNGNSGSITDNVQATSSAMWPTGITIDNAGNIYLADYGNKRIRKINVSGIINTVVGNGDYNYPNVLDGESPLSACLDYPTEIAVDASGNLYIADYGESRVRKVIY